MDLPISLQDITYAENYLAQGDLATATPLLERLVELAEEYIDAECRSRFPLTACTPTWRLPIFASRIM